ncbi:MAG: biopolymer transporter ExbD [bacterium]|jgi:biopolymer transport protein ExbD
MIRRPKHDLPVIPTANLVDIAILLIIFYMACSNFLTATTGKIVPPKAPDLVTVEEPLVIVSIDQEGNVSLQGREAGGVAVLESALTDLLRDKTTDKTRTVMFKCDATVSREVYQPVLDAIVQAGGLILAVGEKQ